MFVALDKDDNLIDIKNAEKGGEFICKFCHEKLYVKARNSIKRATHFCHMKNSNCVEEWAQHDMSEWHRNWQNYFPLENREVIVKDNSVKHIADILIKNTVIEFQHSPISYKNFNQRNLFYTNIGYPLVWIFDANDKIIFDRNEKCFYWKEVQNQFENFNNSVEVFLEVIGKDGIPKLFKPERITPTEIIPNTGFWFRIFSRESFLKDFGNKVPDNIYSILEMEYLERQQLSQQRQSPQRIVIRPTNGYPVLRGARIDYITNTHPYFQSQKPRQTYNRNRRNFRKK